ncbi:hypothetical protein AX15_007733 [Amanita polypyramis BW_CC]|nr:hypothetical protein AX15_007733 [Amanita polypyramis BW_CC]
MTVRDRTAHWVKTFSTDQAEFYSPSIPPSELDDYTPSTPSDTGSSHSIPPRMLLRYGDGRPDLPISHTGERYGRHNTRNYDGFGPRSHYDARARGRESGRAYGSPSYVDVRPRRHPDQIMFNTPEEIRVLPAAGSRANPRSRSLPRSDLPPLPQQILPLPPSGSYAPVSHGSVPRTPSSHSRPQHSPRVAQAPSPNHAFYRPTNGYHHPPQVAPNSVIYSHSAPPVLMRHHPSATGHSRTGVPKQGRVMPDGRMEVQRSSNSRTRSASMSGRRPTVVDRSDVSSSDSEPETSYYGSRTRTKTPVSSSGKSITTATSSSQPPMTPSSTMYGKRPFFQRLIHFAGKLSHTGPSRVVSVTDAGDLHRRHSIGGPRH